MGREIKAIDSLHSLMKQMREEIQDVNLAMTLLKHNLVLVEK